jgi:hypothetical protein
MLRKEGACVQIVLDELISDDNVAPMDIEADPASKTRKKHFAYFKAINELGRSRGGSHLSDAGVDHHAVDTMKSA